MGQKAHVFYLTKLVNSFKIYQSLGKFGIYLSPLLSYSDHDLDIQFLIGGCTL